MGNGYHATVFACVSLLGCPETIVPKLLSRNSLAYSPALSPGGTYLLPGFLLA